MIGRFDHYQELHHSQTGSGERIDHLMFDHYQELHHSQTLGRGAFS